MQRKREVSGGGSPLLPCNQGRTHACADTRSLTYTSLLAPHLRTSTLCSVSERERESSPGPETAAADGSWTLHHLLSCPVDSGEREERGERRVSASARFTTHLLKRFVRKLGSFCSAFVRNLHLHSVSSSLPVSGLPTLLHALPYKTGGGSK